MGNDSLWTVTVVGAGVLTLFMASLPPQPAQERAPVILIPGNGGNQLWGRVTNSSDPCLQEGNWHILFVDLWSIWPGTVKCWSKKRTLLYNQLTGRSGNQPGIETRVPGWAGTDSVDYLDPSWSAFILGDMGSYMKPLTKALTGWGYQVGVDLYAAPYDWRYLPQSQNLFPRLKDLIEEAYNTNAHRKVALVAHSLGARYTLMFLQQQTVNWKNKFIHSFTSLGSPWSGVTNAYLSAASGYSLVSLIKSIDVREEQRSSESNIFLLPTKFAFNPNETFIKTTHRNYTITNYYDFFNDIGYPIGHHRLVAMEEIRNDVTHPGVPLHCLYGHGIPTEEMFIYNNEDFPENQPGVKWGDGDGTVNIASLRACEKWDETNTVVEGFRLAYHMGILGDDRVLKYLKNVLI